MQKNQNMQLLLRSVELATLEDVAVINPVFNKLERGEIEPRKARTPEDTLLEYNNTKWGDLLGFVSNFSGRPTISDIDSRFLGQKPVVFSLGGDLYKGSADIARRLSNQIVFDYLDSLPEFNTLVEVGAGYGSVLLGYQKHGMRSNSVSRFIGTDFSEAALSIMEVVGETSKTDLILHDVSSSTRLHVPEGSILISHMALSMIPELTTSALDVLLATKPRLVIHFESMWEDFAKDRLGKLQRRYIELCDYNSNLRRILFDYENDGRIEVVDHIPNSYGENCLLPTSIVAWKPGQLSS